MVLRARYLEQIEDAVRRSPITALLGPRQCGKTTLARAFCQNREATFFDLESTVDLNRLQNPERDWREHCRPTVAARWVPAVVSRADSIRQSHASPGDRPRLSVFGRSTPAGGPFDRRSRGGVREHDPLGPLRGVVRQGTFRHRLPYACGVMSSLIGPVGVGAELGGVLGADAVDDEGEVALGDRA
jgi:hypothetical protein